MLKNCGHSVKWKELAVNRMSSVMTRRRVSTLFMIVQQKVLMAVEVFVTTAKGWSQGKNTNRKIAPLIWPLPWALNSYRKNNIESCRNLESSMRKHRAG